MRILIVEDEQNLANFIFKGLQQSGYHVQVINNGKEGLAMALNNPYELILLDLMLPGINGFDFLKSLRSFNVKCPVIIISALSETKQVVEGFNLGAVDYIKKPFDWEELLARINVIRKKTLDEGVNTILVSGLEIDLYKRTVKREGTPINLTSKEFLLLEYLAENTNRVLSKNQIMENVWGLDFDTGSNIVEVHIHQLRKKIDKDFDEKLIQTKVGFGYVLNGIKTKQS